MAVSRAWLAVGVMVPTGLGVAAVPSRIAWAREVRSAADAYGKQEPRCGSVGGDEALARAALQRLSRGRLWYGGKPARGVDACAIGSGLGLASAVPIGLTAAAGAHVGVHTATFGQLAPDRPGLALRAEPLGVRQLLLRASTVAADPDAWNAVF